MHSANRKRLPASAVTHPKLLTGIFDVQQKDARLRGSALEGSERLASRMDRPRVIPYERPVAYNQRPTETFPNPWHVV
jgi:hypothetical protein